MRKPDPKSLASRIAARIERGGPDRLWAYHDFVDLKPAFPATAATLSRLARDGELKRVRRGVYYRPASTMFGETKPAPDATLAASLRRRGAPAVATGLEAWRHLGLTTQVTTVPLVATARRVRLSPVVGHRVRTAVRPMTDWHKGDERAVLDALRSLRSIPGASPAEVLERLLILMRGRKLDAQALIKMAYGEPPRVRALLGALLEEADAPIPMRKLEKLRDSLNPLTSYRAPEAVRRLKKASRWRLK